MTNSGDTLGAFAAGLRDGAGLPALALVSALVGYGAMARESGLDLVVTVTSVVALWGLPAMMTFAEVFAGGGGPVVMAVAIAVVNVRTLPMIVAALPLVTDGRGLRWSHFLLAQFVSPTNWAQLTTKRDQLSPVARPPYFVGFSIILWLGGAAGSALGFLAANDLPPALRLTVLFLTPMFVLLMMSTARRRSGQWAVVFGAAAVPLAMEWSSDWGMLLGGVGAGTLGFIIGRRFPGAGVPT